jgi:phosphoglycolate phosphatase
MGSKFDSIIFDLDGTLWDSTATIALAWQQALSNIGLQKSITADTVRGLAGMPYDAIYDELFPEVESAKRDELKKLCARLELEVLRTHGGVLYPDVKEVLSLLKQKHKLAIVSNCQSGYIETFLEHHQMHAYFSDYECYGNKGLSKAQNIKDVVTRSEFRKPVYIGDTTGDYEASQKAKVPFILAGYGFGKVDTEVKRIDKFTDLTTLLDYSI